MLNKDQLLLAVDDAKKAFDALPSLGEVTTARLHEETKLEMTYDSNAIEGSRLSLRETVIVVNEGVTVGGHFIRDIMAARGFAAGYDAILSYAHNQTPLSVGLIKALHQYVLLGALPGESGEFRKQEVTVRGAPFQPTHPEQIEFEMEGLVDWIHQHSHIHPIEWASIAHAKFETIHPFLDGNGRTGRLLLNLMLLKSALWPINIRFKEDRHQYYSALGEFIQTNNADALTKLIAQRAIDHLQYCIHIAEQKVAYSKLMASTK